MVLWDFLLLGPLQGFHSEVLCQGWPVDASAGGEPTLSPGAGFAWLGLGSAWGSALLRIWVDFGLIRLGFRFDLG